MSTQDQSTDVRGKVREFYGDIAEKAAATPPGCGCGSNPKAEIVTQMYDAPDVTELPEEVTDLSLGCGDPVTLAALQPGQTVLDLGSGGGIDCFLAAQRVGPTGHVIGVDMTASMIEKARANQVKVGAKNVEFRLGEIEHLPVADTTADVVISNCVINLSPDKPQVFREAFRALKPGGQLSISDMMTERELPDVIKNAFRAWEGCVGGMLPEKDYLGAIAAAGFVDIELERVFIESSQAERDALFDQLGLGPEYRDGHHIVMGIGEELQAIDLGELHVNDLPRIFSGKVKARKPL